MNTFQVEETLIKFNHRKGTLEILPKKENGKMNKRGLWNQMQWQSVKKKKRFQMQFFKNPPHILY